MTSSRLRLVPVLVNGVGPFFLGVSLSAGSFNTGSDLASHCLAEKLLTALGFVL